MHSPPNPAHPHRPGLSFHQSHGCWAALPCCYGDLAVNILYESHSDKKPAAHRREIDGTFLQQMYSAAAREKKREIESELKSFVVFFVTGLVPLLGRDWSIPPVGYFNLVSGTKLLWAPLNFRTILLFCQISILYILQSLIVYCGINLYSWYSVTPLTKFPNTLSLQQLQEIKTKCSSVHSGGEVCFCHRKRMGHIDCRSNHSVKSWKGISGNPEYTTFARSCQNRRLQASQEKRTICCCAKTVEKLNWLECAYANLTYTLHPVCKRQIQCGPKVWDCIESLAFRI